MSVLRILGFATIMTLLAMLSIAPSFIPTAPFLLFIFTTLAGFALTHFFSHADKEERLGVTSIVFNAFAAVTILLGTITNIIHATINELQEASIAPLRQLPIELAVLGIGLFIPLIITNKLKDQRTPYQPILWNLIACTTLYLVALTLQKIAQTTPVHLP